MSRRLSTSAASRSSDSSAVASSSSRSSADQATSRLRRLVDRRLRRRERRTEVVSDGGQQSGPHPVGGGERRSRGHGFVELLVLDQRRCLGCEGADDPLVLDLKDPAPQREHVAVAGGHDSVGVLGSRARRSPPPRRRPPRSVAPTSTVGREPCGPRPTTEKGGRDCPNDSRTRSSRAGRPVSPRSTLPASVPRVADSAADRAAWRVRRAARSTTELTSTATTTKAMSARASLVSPMVNVWRGGVK